MMIERNYPRTRKEGVHVPLMQARGACCCHAWCAQLQDNAGAALRTSLNWSDSRSDVIFMVFEFRRCGKRLIVGGVIGGVVGTAGAVLVFAGARAVSGHAELLEANHS